jgi:tetratricopeptide (TPR) repeat protein
VAIDAQSSHNQQDLIDWIDARLPADIQGQRREYVIAAILEKSGGTFLYLNLVERENMLKNVDPARLPDKLDGFFKQTFSRYFPDIARYGQKTEPFLRLMVAAPGPLPTSMGAEILGWGRRDLMLNITEPMGSLLKERDDGWVFFHASLSDWLQDPLRSGEHCVNDGGHALLGQFVWNEFAKPETSAWQGQLLDWLAELAPHSGRWTDSESLTRGAAFLEGNRRFIPARGLRKRVLMLCGDGPELLAAALEGLADNYTESAIGDDGRSNFDHAIELLKSAWEIRGKVYGPDHPLTLMTLAKIPYGEAGLYREGRRALETVLQHSQSLSAGEIRKVQAHYAYYLYEGGEFQASREIYQRLLEMCAQASVERATALSLVGFIEYELGHWDESKSFCEQALAELDDAKASPWPIHLASTIKLNLAMCLSALGRHDDARTQAIDAKAGFSTVMTESYPWWGSIWLDMGLIMLAGGHLEEAARLADKAAAVSEAGLGEEHYEPTCAWMLQAWFSIRELHLDKATTLIDRAIRVRGQTLPAGHWRTLVAQENLAFAWRSRGRVDRVDAIVLGWAADLPEEFSSTLSLETTVRMTCRISESLWRAGQGERARVRLSPAIKRCRDEGRFDVASRLLRIQQQMDRRPSHG